MRNGYGQSASVGRKNVKSNVMWIEYDIDWYSIAKSNCKKCHGRGIGGYEPQSEEDKAKGVDRNIILCDCVGHEWSKMTDEQRLQHATKKENAKEIVEKAKEEIRKIAKEEKEKIIEA